MKKEGRINASALLMLFIVASAFVTQRLGYSSPSSVRAASLPFGDGETAHLRLSSSSYSPTRVFPGDEDVEVTVTVVNTGDETADNSRAKIGFPEGFAPSYEGSGVVNLGSISSGSTSSFTFDLDVADSVEAKTYELKLYLEWHGGENTEEIPIRVSEKAYFTIVNVGTSKMRIEPGDTSIKITIMLKNEGEVDAEEVAARLKGSIFSVTTIIFLGTIYAGQTVPAIFEVDIDSSSPTGTVDGQLHISWLQKGRTIDATLTFPLTIHPPLIPWYGWVGLVVLVAFVIYRLRGRLTRGTRERR
jgi:hypothetical protein